MMLAGDAPVATEYRPGTYLPFLLPPIITGLSLLIFFAQFGISRGIATMAVGHSVFVLALLYRLVLARLKSLPRSLIEASADLGATRWQTFRLILWPLLRPVVVTGGILAFALSFDETQISVFLAGNSATLPLRLWAMMRVGFTPEINALVTLVLITTIVMAVVIGLRMKPDERDYDWTREDLTAGLRWSQGRDRGLAPRLRGGLRSQLMRPRVTRTGSP